MLQEIQIEEVFWNASTQERKKEWKTNIENILSSERLQFHHQAHRLHISVTSQELSLAAFDTQDENVVTRKLSKSTLTDWIEEYIDVIRQIDKSEELAPQKLEVLDMAKKTIHDKAGTATQELLRVFEINHETGRKIFTLIFSIWVDTTKMLGVYRHRRIF